MRQSRSILLFCCAAAACGLTACASSTQHEVAYGDPLEGVNRPIHGLNETVSERVVAPVANRVDGTMSEDAESGTNNTVHHIKNVFSNLGEPTNALNGALQGEPATVGVAASRFAINTTVGVLGIFDVADAIHLHERREDFGQTMGKWGTAPGPYMVAPLGGSTNVRDFSGGLVDGLMNPVRLPEALSAAKMGVNAVDTMDQAQDVAARPEEEDSYMKDRRAYEQARADEIMNIDHIAHERREVEIEHRYGARPDTPERP